MQFHGQHIHFMGVGGIGVSALAEMAYFSGAKISGCDREANDLTNKLRRMGIEIFIGHDATHMKNADLLVYSSAIPPDHPERLAAGANQEMRGQFLARFLNESRSLGVSGTHGKTTTTWLLSSLLIQAGLDPSVFIGGIVPALSANNYRLGTGPFVSELDESDASFLFPRLHTAIITNVESDHLSHYRNDETLFAAFRRFAEGVAADGLLIAGVDNGVAADIFNKHRGRKISFGFTPHADLSAECGDSADGINRFVLRRHGHILGQFTLALPGRHNVLNSLAALAASFDLGMDVDAARRYLPKIQGVARRLERIGNLDKAFLYSDYAHHPTEVAASLTALRQRHHGKILVIFQPHLYTRTRDYAEAFGQALVKADAVVLVDIYPAREAPIPGVDSSLLLAPIRRTNTTVYDPIPLDATGSEAKRLAKDFDVVVFMGAGDIDMAARRLVDESGGISSPRRSCDETPSFHS